MNPAQITIGLDLGDRRHTACVLDASGEILAEETLVNTRAALEVFSARFPAALLLLFGSAFLVAGIGAYRKRAIAAAEKKNERRA